MSGYEYPPTKRVMVDLETLGLGPKSVILSIGAVKFSREGLGEEFYRSVDMESCAEAGLNIEAGTLQWWFQQDSQVQDILTGGDSLEEVLDDFTDFYGDSEEIWANSPTADCEWLKGAYEAVGLEVPWGFRQERDYRTLRALPGAVWVDREGNEHDALDDAKHQARKAYKTLNRYNEEFNNE